jgi:hypothetical protein
LSPVTLRPSPPLGPGIDAFPRIADDNPAAQRINRALEALDQRFRAFAAECKGSAGPKVRKVVTRKIRATLRGARYLSLVADDDWDCGAAHPDTDTLALTYDLQTGSPVNWQKMFPATFGVKAFLENISDGTAIGLVRSTRLVELYVKYVVKDPDYLADCTDLQEDPNTAYQVWLAAKEGGIALQPNLPHVASVCAVTAFIPAARLRQSGMDAILLDDIDNAHARGN